ncbi:hypothetical protein CRI94_11090 [Longibacter salinarum]|uniref:Uncharacterized protein n=1 Tax=Longibacter salinarum TaxID=1850348 RepID=A0A2A8CX40_9BACT|nr:hypothetical protein [Longibacter salinarum]PEN13181.1 hypothetical protein CRI94_11090 [Longibacter salinarum]
METENRRPVSVRFLAAAVLFQGVSGLAGGIGLILDPSGASLAIPIEWLDGSPFDSYLMPGVILFIVLGLYPVVVWYGIRQRWQGAWLASLSVGFALVVWIGVEILVIGYQPTPPLQPIYGLLGLAILGLASVSSSRRYLRPRLAE